MDSQLSAIGRFVPPCLQQRDGSSEWVKNLARQLQQIVSETLRPPSTGEFQKPDGAWGLMLELERLRPTVLQDAGFAKALQDSFSTA